MPPPGLETLLQGFPDGFRRGHGTDGEESFVWKTSQGRFIRVRMAPASCKHALSMTVLEDGFELVQVLGPAQIIRKMVSEWLETN